MDRRRRLTFFSGIPTIYMQWRRYYQPDISRLPAGELAEYVTAARQFWPCLCGTSAFPQPLNDFWTDLMGTRTLQRYDATGSGAVFKVRLDDNNIEEGSVGGSQAVLTRGYLENKKEIYLLKALYVALSDVLVYLTE